VQQAGGKLQPIFIRELVAALPQAEVFVMYGQTEATARLSYLPPGSLGTKLGSIGKGIPGVALQVLHESGRSVLPGEVGEIVARGDNVSPGYFNDPETSAAKFVDGALQTEDLATVDEDGFIFVVDRKSDFIKSLGHRVSSQEVEAKILELHDVVGAAAIGQPDPVQGEAIVVFLTLRKGARIATDDVLNHCRVSMARHMVPRQVVVVDSLPTNAHGKIVKSLLRQRLEASLGAGTPA
jgi:acyl-CoA synthetase (AMP-forming)/AMP-acid ligase II